MPRVPTAAAAALALCLLAAGCGADGAPRRGDGGTDETPCVPGQAFDLTGTFGVLVTFNTTVDVLGLTLEDPNPQAWILILARAQQQDVTVTLAAEICDLKIPEIQFAGQPQPVIFSAPPGLLRSAAGISATADLGGLTTCSSFRSPGPMVVVLGTRLADPIADPLPGVGAPGCDGDPLTSCAATTATSCICDQEGDGLAAATVDVANAPVLPDLNHVLATMRASVQLLGAVESSDVLRGPAEVTMEQSIIGCMRRSGPCDAAATTVVQRINPTVAQDPRAPSSFLAKRVDPTYDCARLGAERLVLFPP
ncbi:MAG TPA: hypothetical protein VGQ83_29520 [Polyangia bacterium]